MTVYTLQREQVVDVPLERVFTFFADAQNLDLVTPPWLRFEIVTPLPLDMRRGTLIDYRLRYRGFPLKWRTLIEEWDPPHRFVDRALRSPYKLWHHTHRFEPAGDGTRLIDEVRYALPLGPLGRVAHAVSVRRDVQRIFDYRQARIPALLGARVPPATAAVR